MDKTKMKKVETFASIFGEDHSEVPSEKTDGTTSLKLNDLIPFRNHPFKIFLLRHLLKHTNSQRKKLR